MISDRLHEEGELHKPPPELAKNAHCKSLDEYKKMYARSIEHPEAFWGEIAGQFHWSKEWDKLQNWNYDLSKGPVKIEWFLGGETNVCYNAIDRHIKAAFHRHNTPNPGLGEYVLRPPA